MDKYGITIDESFKSKLSKLTDEEFEKLEKNILEDGAIQDPLIVWKQEDGTRILIDGHNRLRVAEKHGLDFEIVEMEFPDRLHVELWICRHQLGRRNLNGFKRKKLIQEEYEILKKLEGAPEGNDNAATNNQRDQNGPVVSEESPKMRTRDAIAKEHGISPTTVQRNVEFGRGLDAGESVEPGFTSAVLDGTIKASCKDISALRNKEGKEPEQAVQAIIEKPEKKVNTDFNDYILQ